MLWIGARVCLNHPQPVAVDPAASVGFPDELLESSDGASTVYAKSAATDFDIAVFDMLTEPNQGATLVGARTPGGEHAVAMVYSDDTGRWHASLREAWTGEVIADVEVFDASFTFVDAAVGTDPAALLRSGVDGVVIAAATDAHPQLILAAAEAGRFVVRTDPSVAVSIEERRAAVAVAASLAAFLERDV